MWRSISRPPTPAPQRPDTISSPMKRSPHHYSVDCARAHKGLFVGILILVLTIISLILFFVLISRPDFVALAVTEVTICELLIYGTATIATIIGMIQIRHLQYDWYRSFSLDDILLVGAQTGSFLYNIFTVIAGHFTLRSDDMLVPLNALASIVQTACQTLFILDASRRQAITQEHIRKKPGREIVTFMLVVNLAMWAISTLEKSRAESHPIQLNFYGLWAWTIITHVSMPLAIFYRFHSTVCLCEIWKRAYKLKPTYMWEFARERIASIAQQQQFCEDLKTNLSYCYCSTTLAGGELETVEEAESGESNGYEEDDEGEDGGNGDGDVGGAGTDTTTVVLEGGGTGTVATEEEELETTDGDDLEPTQRPKQRKTNGSEPKQKQKQQARQRHVKLVDCRDDDNDIGKGNGGGCGGGKPSAFCPVFVINGEWVYADFEFIDAGSDRELTFV